MRRAGHRYLLLAMGMAVLSSLAHAGKGDDPAPSTTSYFQGTWVGNWQSESRDGTGRDVTITVGTKNPDGTCDIEYSWGSGEDIKRNHIIPGSVKGKAREDGGRLVFEFNDPLSLRKNSIVMTKHEDGKAKAQTNYEARKLIAYLRRK
jgi:hypothetical protein